MPPSLGSRGSTPTDDGNSNTRSTSEKRAFDHLLEHLTVTGRAKKKQKALSEYEIAGRHLCRNIDPFINVSMAFYFGMTAAAAEKGDESSIDMLKTINPKDLTTYTYVFDSILAVVPGFKDRLPEFVNNDKELQNLISEIKNASFTARQTDTGHLRNAGLEYIMPDSNDQLTPRILTKGSKSTRGFHHPAIAKLLCPARLIEDFDKNPTDIIAKLESGRILVHPEDLPWFLFDEYNCDDIDEGLLRGYFLIRVYKHIFTGPTSALRKGPALKKNRQNNADLSMMTEVTPRSIAYAAVQARFMLSNTEQWTQDDGYFDMYEFFKTIIELFEDEEVGGRSTWSEETLKWWNAQIFRKSAAQNSIPTSPRSGQNETTRSRLMEQRRAKRQRARPD